MPTFIADGTWKRYVGDGRGLVFVPPATPERTEPMAWQSAALMGFSMPGGYFLGPVGPERIGKWPFNDRPTATLLFDVGYRDKSVDVTPEARQAAADDLRLWRADAVVLPDGQQNHDKLLAVVTDLLGPGRRVDDVWLWDVRALTTGP